MDDLSKVRELFGAPGPSTATVVRGRERLQTVIACDAAPPRSTRTARWATFGLGLAGAAAAAAIVLSTAPPPSAPTAQEVLLAAATSAAKQPAEGTWWGTKLVRGVRFRDPDDRYTLQQTAAEETWIPAGRVTTPHWIVLRYLGARPATPADEAAWRAAGTPDRWSYTYGSKAGLDGDPYDVRAAPGEARSFQSRDVDWRLMFTGKPLTRLDELPATPEGLRSMLEPASGDERELLMSLENLIVHVPVTPECRAAAYRLMASLPGVSAGGEVTDQLGRTGQAVSYRQQDAGGPENTEVRTRLIVDSATGAPLALETLAPGTGELLRFTAVEANVWTDQKPELPNPETPTEGQ